jgi:hypothetical protein
MIWISLAIMISTIVVSLALLRSWRGDALGIPLVAIGSFVFIYVIQPVQLLLTGTNRLFVTDWQMSEGLLVSALMLAFFMWGWLYPNRVPQSLGMAWDRRIVWRFGFWTAALGLSLYIVFIERSGGFATSYSQAHGQAMAWEQNTAYLYYGPWFMLSGGSMMILADPKSPRRKWLSFIPYGFLILYFADAIMGGDRGPVFSVASIAFISYSIARRKRVELLRAIGLLVLIGSLVVFVFSNRAKLHLGGNESAQVESSAEGFHDLVGTNEYDQEHGTSGQEFLYHVVQLNTVDQTGKLDYGVSWLEFLVINPIPKLLWPEKTVPPPIGVTWADIREHTSLAIAPGSAPGIVADIYARFHLGSMLFFFALGYGLRRLFIEACSLKSPVTTVGYVMAYAVSLNMFAQGFGAIFVPLGYSMAPVLLCAWVTRESRRRARHRQKELMLRQFVALRGEQWLS